ncbi:MAG TPA: DUF6391 domain-containing protein [Kofleriaceae bacterium]|nr:DUF6391 domain-containing protein [Kofleriaceae bacterium]
MSRAFTFWCDTCELEWADGVDYTTCPRCGHDVRWIEPARATPQTRTVLPPVSVMASRMLVALVAVQTVLALLAPHDFAYLRVVLVVAQVGAAVATVMAFALVPAMRGLLTERMRILHGLEHATIAVLRERDIVVPRGLTYDRMFELELAGEDGARTDAEMIATACDAAIARVKRGEHALVFTEYCGTSLVVGWLLVALAVSGAGALALVYHVATGYAFAGTVALFVLARRLTGPLGLFAQRMFTVSPRFASARVRGVDREVTPDGRRVVYTVRVDVEPISSVIGEAL